jgi:muramidase (phage lysozyme)
VNQNRKAFLDMIAVSEGTSTIKRSDNGYNVLVGGALFSDYSDHPRVKVWIANLRIYSTAAGRYQLLSRYYDAYKKQLKLHDFSPASQDAIALQQIRERGALKLIDNGNIEDAIKRVRNIWASLPGAGYGQHEHKIEHLLAAYRNAGGEFA